MLGINFHRICVGHFLGFGMGHCMPSFQCERAYPRSHPNAIPNHDQTWVRVLRIKYGPHEKSKMHGHPASVTVFLNDCEARFTYPDGKTEDIKAKAGQVVFFPAFEHEPENLGDKPFEVIGIELKG